MLVPPLPLNIKQQNEKKLPKRLNLYQRFLNALLKHEVFKSSLTLVDFLKASDPNVWQYRIQTQEKTKSYGILSQTGRINVHYSEAA